MQYNQPFDQPLIPLAAYVNGNPGAGIAGSIPPAAQMEYPQREIVNTLAAAGLTSTNGDLTQLAQAMSIGLWLGPMGGSANALADVLPTLATTADGVTQYAIPSLQPGMTFHGIVAATNTGPATLTLTGFGTAPGAKPIVRKDGSPLQLGDLIAGATASWKWDGTVFRIVGMVASDVLALIQSGMANFINCPTYNGNVYAGVLSPSPAALVSNTEYLVYFGAVNTAVAPQIKVNNLATVPILKQNGGQVQIGDIVPPFMNVAYSSGMFYLTEPVASDIVALTATTPVGKTTWSRSAPGTYTFVVPSKAAGYAFDVYFINTEVWGAGGGGGGANGNQVSSSGGSAGGYSRGTFAVTPGQSITVVVGPGGAAGTNNPTNGGAGGTSSVGSFNQATGGGGGLLASGNQVVAQNPTVVGVGSGGSYNTAGDPGSSGFVAAGPLYYGGAGGGTVGAGRGNILGRDSNGNPGTRVGQGGDGTSLNSSGALSGGRGGDGLVNITY